MTSPNDEYLKRQEEAKRDRHWDPVERWRVIQEMIDWGEAQVGRNTKARCLEIQKILLARLESK